MEGASKVLEEFNIAHEVLVTSAHRTPERTRKYVQGAKRKGIQIFIAGAGGAAHLAGVAAAMTHLPILGCPMKAWSTEGLDSLLSMAQMPKGIPVGTLAVGSAGAINAALLAVSILSLSDASLREGYLAFRAAQSEATFSLPGAPGHPSA